MLSFHRASRGPQPTKQEPGVLQWRCNCGRVMVKPGDLEDACMICASFTDTPIISRERYLADRELLRKRSPDTIGT